MMYDKYKCKKISTRCEGFVKMVALTFKLYQRKRDCCKMPTKPLIQSGIFTKPPQTSILQLSANLSIALH
jgi:hypothetical protein